MRIQKAGSEARRGAAEAARLHAIVEMAVVVSEDGDEEKRFAKQKFAIKPHRERMNRARCARARHRIQLQRPRKPLQLVFVCAMWLTGFDTADPFDAVSRQADEKSHVDADALRARTA